MGGFTYILIGEALTDNGGQFDRKVFGQYLGAFSQESIDTKNRGVRKWATEDAVPKSASASNRINLEKGRAYLMRGTELVAGRTFTSAARRRALVMATESARVINHQPQENLDHNLTSLVARIIIDQSKDCFPRSFAHVTTSLANHPLKGLHHGVLDTKVGGLRSSNKF